MERETEKERHRETKRQRQRQRDRDRNGESAPRHWQLVPLMYFVPRICKQNSKMPNYLTERKM